MRIVFISCCHRAAPVTHLHFARCMPCRTGLWFPVCFLEYLVCALFLDSLGDRNSLHVTGEDTMDWSYGSEGLTRGTRPFLAYGLAQSCFLPRNTAFAGGRGAPLGAGSRAAKHVPWGPQAVWPRHQSWPFLQPLGPAERSRPPDPVKWAGQRESQGRNGEQNRSVEIH